ncbi:MAG: hypothetical protein IT164_19560 [Bryobacterales bacterium]|nr:hypothetical protein [Bryobacterales bacterium]
MGIRRWALLVAGACATLMGAGDEPEGRLLRRGHVLVGLPESAARQARQEPPRTPPAPCNLQPTGEYPGLFSAAATSYTYHLRSTGTLRGVLLFLEFPGARTMPGDATTQTLYDELAPPYTRMMASLSYNRVRVEITPIHKWYLMPRDFHQYPLRTYGDLRTFFRDVISAADFDVSFASFDFITVITAQSLDVGAAQAFLLLPGVEASADGVPMKFMTFIPRRLRFPDVLAHENLHLMGLQDLYLLDAHTNDDSIKPFGRWDIMSSGYGLTAWHKEKLGWIEPSQITCLAAGSGEALLTPVGTPNGVKALAVPISPTRVMVAEARETGPDDPALCESGVILYTVDSTVPTGSGPFQIKPAKLTGPTLLRSCSPPEPNAYAAYGTGAQDISRHFEPGPNLLFEVTRKQATGYTVRVRTVAGAGVVPRALQKLSGDNQAVSMHSEAAEALAVRVLNGNGQPVPNPSADEYLPVQWHVVGGTATITSATSDASGEARARVKAGGSSATIVVRASIGSTAQYFSLRVADGRPVPAAVVNGAAFTQSAPPALAPGSWAVLTGAGLAAQAASSGPPYPVSLAGTSVTVRDSLGVSHFAPLYYVSPGQINFLVPENAAFGAAAISVSTELGGSATPVLALVRAVAPGVFTANATGAGVAAGFAARVKSSGEVESVPLFVYDEPARRYENLPLRLAASEEPVYLVLYGTGLRGRSGLPGVRLFVGGVSLPVQYAGPQGGYAGLDQVNAGPLPAALGGAGLIAVQLEVDGELANTVTLAIE